MNTKFGSYFPKVFSDQGKPDVSREMAILEQRQNLGTINNLLVTKYQEVALLIRCHCSRMIGLELIELQNC